MEFDMVTPLTGLFDVSDGFYGIIIFEVQRKF